MSPSSYGMSEAVVGKPGLVGAYGETQGKRHSHACRVLIKGLGYAAHNGVGCTPLPLNSKP